MLFVPSVGANCIVEYRDFIDLISKQGRFANMPRARQIKHGLWRFGEAIGFILIFLAIDSFVDWQILAKPEFGEWPFYK